MGSSQNVFGKWRRSLSYVRCCHREAMQLLLSRTRLGMPFSLRQAAAASPDGPAPIITGPVTRIHLVVVGGVCFV